MEKITKEELFKKFGAMGLTDEQLKKIAGGEAEWPEDIDGDHIDEECMHKCLKSFKQLYSCMKECVID